MFKATRLSVRQMSHVLSGGGCKMRPMFGSGSGSFTDHLHTPTGPTPPSPINPMAGTCHYGGVNGSLHQYFFGYREKCQQIRFYRSNRVSRSTDDDKPQPQPQRVSPQLMDFPWVVWPSLWHSIRNWIFANLLIHRYLDQEFDMTSFKNGAIQALVYVSQELSKGNFETIEDLVTTPSLDEIKKNFAKFSMKQRLDLAVEKEDIFFSFPYQIGMIFTNEGSSKERIFVEITMCYHIFRGFQDHVSSASGERGMRGVYDNNDRISIANYRFIREFTKGVVDDWTISLANHFKPGELANQFKPWEPK